MAPTLEDGPAHLLAFPSAGDEVEGRTPPSCALLWRPVGPVAGAGTIEHALPTRSPA